MDARRATCRGACAVSPQGYAGGQCVTSSTRRGDIIGSGPVDRRPLGLLAAALALLAAPAGLLLVWPMDGDQALFHLGAQTLADGGVYYRDFWDIKQPGIYWFYQAGEALTGSQAGPRLLEVLLVLAAGALLHRQLRRVHAHPITQVIGPLLVFAPYLLLAYRAGVGQVEGLAVPLLVVHVVLTGLLDDPDDRLTGGLTWRAALPWLVAGLTAGALAVLKTMYVVLPLTLLAGALAVLLRRQAGAGAVLGRLTCYGVGAAVPLGATLAYLVGHDVLGVAWFTSIELPRQIAALDSLHRPGALAYLLTTAARYLCVPVLGTLVALRAISASTGLRRRWAPAGATLLLATAVFSACVATQYLTGRRLLTYAVLLGIPALLGVDVMARRWREPRVLTVAMAVACVAALAGSQGVVALVRTASIVRPQLDPAAADDFAEMMSGSSAATLAAPVAGLVGPGSGIYVLGDPRVYRRLDARQAVPIIGWSSEFLTPAVWREVEREFTCARPAYVFVDDFSAPYVQSGAPGLLAALRADYVVAASPEGGTWWERRGTGPGSVRPLTPLPECTPLEARW